MHIISRVQHIRKQNQETTIRDNNNVTKACKKKETWKKKSFKMSTSCNSNTIANIRTSWPAISKEIALAWHLEDPHLLKTVYFQRSSIVAFFSESQNTFTRMKSKYLGSWLYLNILALTLFFIRSDTLDALVAMQQNRKLQLQDFKRIQAWYACKTDRKK